VDGGVFSTRTDRLVHESARLLNRDRDVLWHPYSPRIAPETPWLVEDAAGAVLTLSDGRERFRAVDAMSSWWCMIHGYRNPVLDAAVKKQVDRFSHVMFGGLTHAPAIELAERLVDMTPESLRHVFLADSGSISVEVAIKLSLQYQVAKGRGTRRRLLTVRGGYHGDTFATMSVCDPDEGMHRALADTMIEQVFGPVPPPGFHRTDDDPEVVAWAQKLWAHADQKRDEIAAIVIEPILQGAGGMRVYSPSCLRVLRDIAIEHDFLLIFDEIATGFGRTGALFAGEHTATGTAPAVEPDILCVGKAMTGGYMTLAATLCSDEVADTVSIQGSGALLHGPTFMANPLACAVSIASIDLLLGGDWSGTVARINDRLTSGLSAATALSPVREVRTIGAVGVVQLHHPVAGGAVSRAAFRRGGWVRPFRDLVYTMPPYTCTDDELDTITSGIVGALEDTADAGVSR
jgi:adenosylmethionine-8-amino-7-oxononanoate aminotransferase